MPFPDATRDPELSRALSARYGLELAALDTRTLIDTRPAYRVAGLASLEQLLAAGLVVDRRPSTKPFARSTWDRRRRPRYVAHGAEFGVRAHVHELSDGRVAFALELLADSDPLPCEDWLETKAAAAWFGKAWRRIAR